jgi:ribosomal S17-like protein
LLTTTPLQYFDKPQQHLVHDPNNSLRTGDVVAISPGWRTSKSKRYVVKHIIAPAQVPIEERNPVPTEEERWAGAIAKFETKVARKASAKAARREGSATKAAEAAATETSPSHAV